MSDGTATTKSSLMKFTPEMIDAMCIQLDGAFQTGDDIPDYVKRSGQDFMSKLSMWANELRKK